MNNSTNNILEQITSNFKKKFNEELKKDPIKMDKLRTIIKDEWIKQTGDEEASTLTDDHINYIIENSTMEIYKYFKDKDQCKKCVMLDCRLCPKKMKGTINSLELKIGKHQNDDALEISTEVQMCPSLSKYTKFIKMFCYTEIPPDNYASSWNLLDFNTVVYRIYSYLWEFQNDINSNKAVYLQTDPDFIQAAIYAFAIQLIEKGQSKQNLICRLEGSDLFEDMEHFKYDEGIINDLNNCFNCPILYIEHFEEMIQRTNSNMIEQYVIPLLRHRNEKNKYTIINSQQKQIELIEKIKDPKIANEFSEVLSQLIDK